MSESTIPLARTLAEPPAACRAWLRAARWGAFVWPGFPTLMAPDPLATLLPGPRLEFDRAAPGLWVALHHVPALLLSPNFALQALLRIEIPPWPRPLRAVHGRGAGAQVQTPPTPRPADPTPPAPALPAHCNG